MQLHVVPISKPPEVNVILGQTHFIKTAEDLYEALVGAVPGIKFGLAFCEASGACLIRTEGTDEQRRGVAVEAARALAAGHTFVIALSGTYPVNVLNAVKSCPEVCHVFCATANPVSAIVAETDEGRGVLGVIDGAPPQGVEDDEGVRWRRELLRQIGYKK
jgi:adenosine/AMP kinase